MPEDFSYKQIQNWMQAMVLRQPPTGHDSIMADVKVNELVNSSERLNALRHLNIYQGSYIARLRECMQNQFKTLAYALGRELFEGFADEYLEKYPSGSYTLNDLGKNFAKFLEETRPDAGLEEKEDWPDFMIELARFEYDMAVIFDEQANEDGITPANEATPDEALTLLPVFHLFHHTYPVCRYYLDHASKKEPELPFAEESYCVVLRQNYKLGLFVIKPAQYHFLSSLKNGASIPEALNDITTAFYFDTLAADNLWKDWRKHFIACGFFVGG